jgi:hypothetical protein
MFKRSLKFPNRFQVIWVFKFFQCIFTFYSRVQFLVFFYSTLFYRLFKKKFKFFIFNFSSWCAFKIGLLKSICIFCMCLCFKKVFCFIVLNGMKKVEAKISPAQIQKTIVSVIVDYSEFSF